MKKLVVFYIGIFQTLNFTLHIQRLIFQYFSTLTILKTREIVPVEGNKFLIDKNNGCSRMSTALRTIESKPLKRAMNSLRQ